MSVLPIYHVIALPGAKLWLRQEFYRQQTGKTASVGDKVTVLFQKDQVSRSELTGDSFYNIGTAGSVSKTDSNGFITVDLNYRVNVEEVVVMPNGNISMTMSRKPDVLDLNEAEAKKRNLPKEISGRRCCVHLRAIGIPSGPSVLRCRPG